MQETEMPIPPVTLPVPYIEQEKWNYCGPACAQMVIEFARTTNPALVSLTQDDLFNDHCHSDEVLPYFATNPDGLADTLGTRAAAASPTGFLAHQRMTEPEISRRLSWMIFAQGRPAIALIKGWGHWVVVIGGNVSAVPATPDDPAVTIDSFIIHDPFPVGTLAAGEHQREDVPYAEWQTNYLVPVPNLELQGMHIAVSDP
jgi:hypothetical protein